MAASIRVGEVWPSDGMLGLNSILSQPPLPDCQYLQQQLQQHIFLVREKGLDDVAVENCACAHQVEHNVNYRPVPPLFRALLGEGESLQMT